MRKILRAYLVISCVCAAFSVRSQNQAKADSVRDLVENSDLSTSEKLQAYYWLSVYSGSPEEELNYGRQLLELANTSNNKEYIIRANLRIGVAHRLLGNLGKALEHLFESADEASESDEFKPLLADIYQEISTCYTQNGDSENALLYGSKTIDILRSTGNKQRLALTLLNAGYDYYLINEYDSAMACYNESEPILQEIGMTIGLAYIIGNRALVYWKKGENERARKDLRTAIDMLEPLDDRFGMADYYIRLGHIFLEESKHQEGIDHAMKGLEMAEEEGMKEQIRDASYLLFMFHGKIGDHQKAVYYQTQHYAYKDSIQNLETTQRLANLRTAFEVGQKQAEVDLLLEQKRSNQIIMITGGIILLGVICIALIIDRNSRSRSRLNKQLEEQKDALVTLNNTKDKFFSIISHDLRGPVNNISGLVAITRFQLKDENPEDLKDTLDKMENSVDHLVKLLDNLLHWALLQRGSFPYTPENLNLKSTLTEVGEMFENIAASKNIQLDFDLKEDFEVFADKNTASTMFRNLLSNAIKFTQTGGHIKVSTEKNSEGGTGIVRFIDDGVGIPEEKLKGLFSSGSNSTTKGTSGENGLGLGLQLVSDFIELNHGKIEVNSAEGSGTTFTVLLPLDGNNNHPGNS